MGYQNPYQNNLKKSQGEEAAIQQRVQSELGNARASGNPLLYFRSRGILPAGYKVDDRGKLQYVQVNSDQHWYTDPKVMIPTILTAGYTLGGGAPAAAQASGSALPTLGSHAIGSGLGVAPSLAGSSTLGGSLAGSTALSNTLPLLSNITGPLAPSGVPTIASHAVTSGMAGAAPSVAPSLSLGGGGGGGRGFATSFGGDLLKSSLVPGLNMGLNYFMGRSQINAANKAADAQIKAANYAAELAAKGNADALAFLKAQEEQRRIEHDKIQGLNLQQYNDQLARTAPYRTLGGNAVASLQRGLSSGNGAQYLPGPTIRRTLG